MLHGQLLDLVKQALSRTALATLALAVLSLAGPNAGTAWADAAQVTVVSPGGSQQTLSLDALAGSEDVVDRAYTLRSGGGESAQTVTGFSLAAILVAAGADPYGFSYLEAQRPAGGSVLLSRDQALDPGAFADGPPVVYATAGGTGFLRPSADPGDLNATDSFEAPQGVTIVLRKGSPLRVRAKASTVRTRPGRPVAFNAIVDRAGSGEELSYSWYFDDGHSASGADVRHSFAERGSYDVVIGVTTPGDSAGASAVVMVQVGPPLAGPDRRGGGTNEDAGAPDHGAATGGGDADAGGGVPTEPRLTAPATPQPDEARTRAAKRSTDGRRVSGLLLTHSEESPPEPTATPAARTGQLDGTGSGASLPGAALGLLLTAGLLGAGALVEVRG